MCFFSNVVYSMMSFLGYGNPFGFWALGNRLLNALGPIYFTLGKLKLNDFTLDLLIAR